MDVSAAGSVSSVSVLEKKANFSMAVSDVQCDRSSVARRFSVENAYAPMQVTVFGSGERNISFARVCGESKMRVAVGIRATTTLVVIAVLSGKNTAQRRSVSNFATYAHTHRIDK